MHQMLLNVAQQEKMSEGFYQAYYTVILHHLFTVMTDTSHTANLTQHATIMAYMFSIVEQGKVRIGGRVGYGVIVMAWCLLIGIFVCNRYFDRIYS